MTEHLTRVAPHKGVVVGAQRRLHVLGSADGAGAVHGGSIVCCLSLPPPTPGATCERSRELTRPRSPCNALTVTGLRDRIHVLVGKLGLPR